MHKTNFYQTTIYLFCTLILVLLAPFVTYADVDEDSDPEYSFSITVEVDGTTIELTGPSEFMMTSSSYSIYMRDDKGNCALHLLNFKSAPGPGTYDVGDSEEIRTAKVCAFNEHEPKERVVSESGTFTITSINSSSLEGHFEIVMKGGISGNIYRVSGSVSSENVPSNLKF